VRIEICYTAKTHYADPRRRGERTKCYVCGTVWVEIAEASGDDAPVATRVRPSTCADGSTDFTRWFGDRHYAPFVDAERLSEGREPRSAAEVLLAASEMHVSGLTTGYPSFDFHPHLGAVSSERYPGLDLAPVEASIAEAEAWADSILIVDGSLWIACAEPYYRTNPHADGGGLEPCRDILVVEGEPRPFHARATIDDLNTLARADEPCSYHWAIEVVIPGSIRRRPERDAVIGAARLLVSDYGWLQVKDIHPDILEGLAAVKRAAWGKPDGEVDCDEACSALSECLDAVAAREGSPAIAPAALAQYRRSVERWHSRAVMIDELAAAPRMA
jgi:hypothetical protein